MSETCLKQKMYALMWNGREGSRRFVEVDGTSLDPSDIYGYDAFVFSDVDQDIEKRDAPFDVYHVVEAQSGVAIGTAFDQRAAIEDARVYILHHGKAYVDRRIANWIQKYGGSPGYAEDSK